MKFIIGVYDAPFTQQGASSAWHFAKAAIKKGHTISQIFFYLNGVYNADKHTPLNADETFWLSEWQLLAEQYGIKLTLCNTAAERRGLTLEQVSAPFEIAGLTQFLHAAVQADRCIIFGK